MPLSTLSHPTAAAAAGSGKSLFPAAPAAQSVRFPKARAPVPAAVSAATAAVRADSADDRVSSLSQVSGVLGSQWGDEGKGKLVDVLAPRFDIVARCQVRGLDCANPCLEESSCSVAVWRRRASAMVNVWSFTKPIVGIWCYFCGLSLMVIAERAILSVFRFHLADNHNLCEFC